MPAEEISTEFNLTDSDCALVEAAIRFFLENQSFPENSADPEKFEKLRSLFDLDA